MSTQMRRAIKKLNDIAARYPYRVGTQLSTERAGVIAQVFRVKRCICGRPISVNKSGCLAHSEVA